MKKIIVTYTIVKNDSPIVDRQGDRWNDRVINAESLPQKVFEGKREFEKDQDAERFLLRLNTFKTKLAFRAGGQTYTGKKKEIWKVRHGFEMYTAQAETAIRNNPFKLSVNIQTITK